MLSTYSLVIWRRYVTSRDRISSFIPLLFNHFAATHDYNSFKSILLGDQITVIGNEMCVKPLQRWNIIVFNHGDQRGVFN